MTKNAKNTNEVAAQVAEVENVNAPETVEGMQDATPETASDEPQDATEEAAEEGTPEELKARRILRAKLPKLSESGLNFEKRTGNFFRSTLEKEVIKDGNGNPRTKADGTPLYKTDDHGKVVEKLRRVVVSLYKPTKDAKGDTVDSDELTDVAAACIDEINAKRAAALLLDTNRRERLEAERKELEKQLAENAAALDTLEADRIAAAELVTAFDMPTPAERVAVTKKVAILEDKNAAMRAKLLELGINPDEI